MKQYVLWCTFIAVHAGLLWGCFEAPRALVPASQEVTVVEDVGIEDGDTGDVAPRPAEIVEPRDLSVAEEVQAPLEDVADFQDGSLEDISNFDTSPIGVDAAAGDADAVFERPCLPAGCARPGQHGCQLAAGWCWLDGACREADSHNPENDCQICDATQSPRAWISRAAGVACDDGLPWTSDDICAAGLCEGAFGCEVSTVTCLEARWDRDTDMCVEDVVDGCYVENTCIAEDAFHPSGCSSCRPALDDRAWTPGDAAEPDDELKNAHNLPTPGELLDATLTTGWSGPWTASRLVPSDDVDVFSFTHMAILALNMPFARVTMAEGVGVRLCVLIKCNPAQDFPVVTTTGVCLGGVGVTSESRADGWVGCCRSTSAASTTLGFQSGSCQANGQFVSTTRVAMIEVQRQLPTTDTSCTPYTLEWGLR